MEKYQDKMTDLLQAYCREFSNWSLYRGIPKYDLQLAQYLKKTSAKLHICITFSEADTEVYLPLSYYSTVGEHQFQFPVHARNLHTKTFSELTAERVYELTAKVITPTPITSHSQELGTESLAVHAAQNSPAQNFHASPSFETIPLSKILDSSIYNPELPAAIFYIQKYIANSQTNNTEAVGQWFYQYLQLLHYHPLESIITVDETGFPLHISKINTITTPANDPTLIEEWIRSVLIGHIFKLIGIIGKLQLHDEDQLISMTYQLYRDRAQDQQDSLASFIITQRHFKTHSNFSKPNCHIQNVLHETYWEADLFQPKKLDPIFSKTYAEEEVTVTIRPFDLDRDLEMVHRWFHREHAKPIWQMNWNLSQLEHFYRCLLANKWGHAFIGEINGIPTFNMEIYWATRDIVGNYFDVLPTDYGTHLFIAPTDKDKKFPSLTMQSIVSWLFDYQKIGRLVGEGAIESMAALMNKVQAGFKLQGIIEMPHKKAHLNFCYREWYWEKFPQNKPHELEPELH
ncbi:MULTISPECIES: GNAT family N-acetyltransferase [unclassified Sphingobacterium]|uniref:GNAT family N-acetyltransferase n=1 Tax=unclassified Sphingobacterium TaxID=2609468 RepID=UPI0010507610|nr:MULTISPECIES: GNAT family N-acetyltransferase [unclassified Sphingobacterium]MCS3556582.1 hypothetical protein [Sphingobacterium sp. JUb21]TCQ99876.1 acetyltransferase (GNAT) family protein [Sphingobacterium sp. JUb20]